MKQIIFTLVLIQLSFANSLEHLLNNIPSDSISYTIKQSANVNGTAITSTTSVISLDSNHSKTTFTNTQTTSILIKNSNGVYLSINGTKYQKTLASRSVISPIDILLADFFIDSLSLPNKFILSAKGESRSTVSKIILTLDKEKTKVLNQKQVLQDGSETNIVYTYCDSCEYKNFPNSITVEIPSNNTEILMNFLNVSKISSYNKQNFYSPITN